MLFNLLSVWDFFEVHELMRIIYVPICFLYYASGNGKLLYRMVSKETNSRLNDAFLNLNYWLI